MFAPEVSTLTAVDQPLAYELMELGGVPTGEQPHPATGQCPPQRGQGSAPRYQRGECGHSAAGNGGAGPAGSDGGQGADHLGRAAQNAARIVVAQLDQRFLVRKPLAG